MSRRATPTPILKLHGGFRQDRHGRRPSPEILAHKRPACPKRFILKGKTDDGEFARKEAKRAWDRLCGPLFEAGLLVDAFYMSFEMLCSSWGLYQLACQKCGDEGLTTTGAKNNEVKSPWARIRAETLDEVSKLAGCYGLTPADIASVKALDRPQLDDAKTRFFGRGEGA